MKKILTLLLASLFCISGLAQNQVAFDNMETWNWPGLWFGSNSGTATWATNHSISPSESAVIYGLGTGTSGNEQAWYVLPNIVGLNPTSQYEFRFRLASYRVTSGNATRGVDGGDFVDVQVSYDGELTYTSELRIAGNNNAFWDYNTTGVINHVANGSYTGSLAPIGDVYQSGPGNQQFTGPSVINLQLPPGITQVAVDLYCRVNAAGEEWWFDNIELVEFPSTPLPVELVLFEVKSHGAENYITWITASELNCKSFTIERSTGGKVWDAIKTINGSGTTSTLTEYEVVDRYFHPTINYYRLTQVDFNGESEIFNTVSIDNRNRAKIVKTINIMGQEVQSGAPGLVIVIYEDGTSRKLTNP